MFKREEVTLDSILEVVRAKTLLMLHDLPLVVNIGDTEGEAIKAAALTLVLLVRRKMKK